MGRWLTKANFPETACLASRNLAAIRFHLRRLARRVRPSTVAVRTRVLNSRPTCSFAASSHSRASRRPPACNCLCKQSPLVVPFLERCLSPHCHCRP